ncbi:MAG: hypothetical protein HYV65_02370 [Candidatus Spechtbacteria bacterium]|nr:hypothetical protein [Candidatus Spechtbacteria bacterium]
MSRGNNHRQEVFDLLVEKGRLFQQGDRLNHGMVVEDPVNVVMRTFRMSRPSVLAYIKEFKISGLVEIEYDFGVGGAILRLRVVAPYKPVAVAHEDDDVDRVSRALLTYKQRSEVGNGYFVHNARFVDVRRAAGIETMKFYHILDLLEERGMIERVYVKRRSRSIIWRIDLTVDFPINP